MTANNKKNHRRHQAGLSLIELMVALLLGIVLTLGAVTLFLQSKVSYLQDEESARLQENGRFALRYLERELSMAGFVGGVLRGDLITDIPSGGSDCFDYLMGERLGADVDSFPFEQYNNVTDVGDPNMPSDCWEASDTLVSGGGMPAPDMLLVRRTRDSVTDPNEPGVTLDDDAFYLEILDANVSIKLVDGSAGTPGNLLEYWEYRPQILFIRDHAIDADDGIPSLCQIVLEDDGSGYERKAETECLAEGVENMQIEVGVDNDGDQRADYFTAAPDGPELLSAVAARIYLLVRSVNPISGYTNDKTFKLGQTDVSPPADGYYRRVLQTTVLLRNSEAYKF